MKHDPLTEEVLALSLSEIAALSARATRGAGRNWGEAEEAAEAACWLARAGLDWAGALLEVLQHPAPQTNCALRIGIALADAAALSSPTRNAHLVTSSPSFLMPFVARAADQSGQKIRLTVADTQVVLAPGACPLIIGPICISRQARVTITTDQHDSPPCPAWPQTHHGAIRATEYAQLTQLMMAFTVPTSAHSQAGAGAQEDDND